MLNGDLRFGDRRPIAEVLGRKRAGRWPYLRLWQARSGACVAGRAEAVDRLARRCDLRDETGRLKVWCPTVTLPEPGDLVLVRGAFVPEYLVAGQVQRLTRYRRRAPFPPQGGETCRLWASGRVDLLRRRARIMADIRLFFGQGGYLEVETPRLVRHPGMEPHLRPLSAGDRFLITSPEYQMKRLLAGGLERIFSLGPCWRGDELGAHHLTEFCMLEWYRAFSSLETLMEEAERLVAHLAVSLRGATRLTHGGQPLDLTPPFVRLSVAEACHRFAGVPILGVTEAARLRRLVDPDGRAPLTPDAPFEEVFSWLMVDRVEPALARLGRPVILHSFPAPLCALSRLDPTDPTVARRFELYAGGLELANAFDELTDPVEQRRRLEQEQTQRRGEGQPQFALDERFLAALDEGMPPAAGIALGVDRLVMLLCDADHIGQVVPFAAEEI